VLRNNRELLGAVLETFIHDPLCEWSKKSSASKAATGEVHNEEAVKHLRNIDFKLRGIKHSGGLPLSIEGQVQELIADATSLENLSAMYIGWAPFL
jgi:serine/threonine-protein kinase ATR